MESLPCLPSTSSTATANLGNGRLIDFGPVKSGAARIPSSSKHLPQLPTLRPTAQPKQASAVHCEICSCLGHVPSSCLWGWRSNKENWLHNQSIPPADTRTTSPRVLSSAHALLIPPPPTMANFPINIVPYLPQGMTVELGPTDRKVRADMVVSAVPPLHHNFLAIAEANRFIPQHQKEALRDTIQGLLHEFHFFPTEVEDHALGLGIFGFDDSLVRDTVVRTTFELDEMQADEHTIISFVPHDVALNMRLTTFGPEIWILYVGFPYDYQTQHYMHKSV